MVGRIWIGLAMILFGIVGLLVGWQIERNGGDTAVLAVFSALALAAGCLLAASAGGEVAVRVTGGLLFVTGFGVAVTNHEAWWWLPSNWQTPVSLAALLVALVGFGVLLFAYGLSLVGLSGSLGLLALTCLALALLPYIGSEEPSVLRAFATALGTMAFTAGVGAATTRRPRAHRRALTAVAGAVAAAVTVYAGYDSYDTYAPGGYHAAVIGATIGGVVGSLAIGVVIAWPNVAGGLTRKGSGAARATESESVAPSTVPMPEQAHEPSSPVEPPASPPQRSAESTPSPPPAEPATTPATPAAETTPRAHDRLQTASLAVGLVIGLITIAKELIAAALAIIH